MPAAYAGSAPPLKHLSQGPVGEGPAEHGAATASALERGSARRSARRWCRFRCQQVTGTTSPAAREPEASRQDRQVNDHLLELAERGAAPQLYLTRAPLQPDRIEHSRPRLVELADRLEAVDPPPVKGLAMATLLVDDGMGALYLYEPSDPLGPAVEAILAALDR